ncbi:DUF29 domain-containing protein [Sphaerospermopsis sp. FACHB-1094]|jgi:hypothetical protein|uniref:DUF29 domain-containing protein n=1 Tax=Sphaerospermopsis aphanizomenoides LEGE 00250 TaxID=2777972 RepID=A0ABR9VHE2_9CYAN|nr:MULTISPECIES: DUF29 domain-containing protein [Sphaerospermopsis]MBD2134944.1 DUF29 domain-containing protein [Sphaerospermopsis sp. FACHB-1094]MBE9237903.1 DUF29 domain-containing protein [Sphaerospermopsis aphanizomenoides LEGE 00250]
MSVISNLEYLQQLYKIDDYEWLLTNIELLKQGKFNDVDLENLIEELADLGNEKKNAVKSLLEQVIRHLLLLQYWTEEIENNGHHWQSEILGFRYQLEDRLTTNLRNFLADELDHIYQRALKYVQVKTKFKVDFPSECPYTLEQLLDVDFLGNW